jgi:hypothetical protein
LIVEGPVFRQVGKGGRLLPGRLSPQNVALIVKAYAKRLGLKLASQLQNSPVTIWIAAAHDSQ